MASSEGTVALVLLLDQFPRNVYRGTPRCFATDAKARDVSRRAIERGFDRLVPPAHRLFLYLPFEHSENLADQDEACARIFTLGRADWLDYARRHRDIVRRFGRFSHRNAILGHPSTPEELAFLRRSNAFF